jgi:hypothetical protein
VTLREYLRANLRTDRPEGYQEAVEAEAYSALLDVLIDEAMEQL